MNLGRMNRSITKRLFFAPLSPKTMTITLGTFCSGTDAPIFALRQADIPHRHVFSAENNPHARTFIQANCSPEHLYADVTALDADTVPRVDLFICGPPCQGYSKMNRARLTPDATETPIAVLKACLRYIIQKRPAVAVLENVIAFERLYHLDAVTDESTAFEKIWIETVAPLFAAIRIAYSIQLLCLNPRMHANCPHNRPRVFLVMRPLDASPLCIPRIPLTVSYESLLEETPDGAEIEIAAWEEDVFRRARQRMGHSWKACVSANVAGKAILSNNLRSNPFANCLIAGRPSVVTARNRRVSRIEMLRLQGFPADVRVDVMSYSEFVRLMGNAINVGVLTKLFEAIYAH